MSTASHSGSYARWLDTANMACRQASPEQRAALRTLARLKHDDLDEYTRDIEKAMGWFEDA